MSTVRTILCAVLTTLPAAAVAQAPVNDGAPVGLSASSPSGEIPAQGHMVRVGLKSTIPGVYLVESETTRPVCKAPCEEELSLRGDLAYELRNARGEYVGKEIRFPISITQATIAYQGKNYGLFVPGVIGVVVGAAGLLSGVVLELAAFAAAFIQSNSAGGLAIAGLIALGGAVIFGVPGAILTATGTRERMEMTTEPPTPAPP